MTATENRPVENEAAPKAFSGADTNNSTPGGSPNPRNKFRATGKETLIARVVGQYIERIADQPEVTPQQIRDELLNRINGELFLENLSRKDEGTSQPQLPQMLVLDEHTIVRVLLARNHIARIDLLDGGGEEDLTILCLYSEEGPNAGIYVTGDAAFSRTISGLAPSLKSREIESVHVRLKAEASVRYRCAEAQLVPVNNGIFNTDTMMLEPFDPELVFLAKSPVDYDANAISPVIVHPEDGTVWEVDSWMHTLSEDPEIVQLLWEVMSAIMRPRVAWNKALFFIGTGGNNGKGTVCHLMRNLVGKSVATLKVMGFSKDFMMTPLLKATAVISDENPVGTFIDEVDNFKAAVTGDPLSINRKHKDPLSATFRGLIVQCLNDEYLRSKDKSESLKRRELPIPFTKRFEGVERKYIKEDYLSRPEVLRYVLMRVLHMTHTNLSEPAVSTELLDQQRMSNDLRVGFWRTVKEQFAWDLVPVSFIYELWRAYKSRVDPDGRPGSQNTLTTFLKEMIANDPEWEFVKDKRPGNLMSTPEHLIAEYELKGWVNECYSGSDLDKRSRGFRLKANYTGLLRQKPVVSSAITGRASVTGNTEGEDA